MKTWAMWQLRTESTIQAFSTETMEPHKHETLKYKKQTWTRDISELLRTTDKTYYFYNLTASTLNQRGLNHFFGFSQSWYNNGGGEPIMVAMCCWRFYGDVCEVQVFCFKVICPMIQNAKQHFCHLMFMEEWDTCKPT